MLIPFITLLSFIRSYNTVRTQRLFKHFRLYKNRPFMSSIITLNINNLSQELTKQNRKDGSHIVKCYVDDYHKLLNEKVLILNKLIEWNDQSTIDVYESPRTHFRMRANFQMWHENPKNRTPDGFFFGMYDEIDKSQPCEITNFPRGTELISHLMKEFLAIFQESKVIFDSLFEVRFLTTQTNEAVVTLLYKRPLSPEWKNAADEICRKLNIKIVGRARKMVQIASSSSSSSSSNDTSTTTNDGDKVIEELTVNGGCTYKYYYTEGAFSQPNSKVCEKMITWASSLCVDCKEEDLLELYCGGGTFTVPLSKYFNRVLATEISKASVELAHKTFLLNNITNIKIARLSSEQFSDAYLNKRSFNRLAESKIDLQSYNITTVLVDPPRAGLDIDTCKLLSQFNKIIYISCNPETLARDVKLLQATHDIVKVAAFDQFPYTHHLESGVYMIKKVKEPTATSSLTLECNNITSTTTIDLVVKVIIVEDELVSDRNIKKPKLTDN